MSDRLLSGVPDQLDYSGLGSFPPTGFGDTPHDGYAGHYATAQGTGEMADFPAPLAGQGHGYGYDQGYGTGYGTGQDTAWGATAPDDPLGQDYVGHAGYQDPSAYQQPEYQQEYQQPEYQQGYQGYADPGPAHPEQQGGYGSHQRYAAAHAEPVDALGQFASFADPAAAFGADQFAADPFAADPFGTGHLAAEQFAADPFGYQAPPDATARHGGWASEPEAFASLDTATFEQPTVPAERDERPWDEPRAEARGTEHQAASDETAEPAAEQLGAADGRDADDEPSAERPPAPRPAAVGKPVGRGRRRSPRPRRSALLSVAAPSLAVLGVTAAATAATVSNSSEPAEPPPIAAPDPTEVEEIAANEQFDTQLMGLSAAVDDYADRASRTQGRMDLEAQIEAEEQAAAEEAARQEELRPKFWLPVEQHGLSAYFGQAGVNWMSTHTGIDFPVSYGTPVMAATDGEVRTQWNPSYGNMVILTAPDGTETWYAHLDSTVFQSGWVQAGTVIAYSGNSGTSTGPHLHFEVRPYGGSAIDPLAWLRGQGLEPT